MEQSEHATLEETKGENQENEMENPYEKYRLEAEQKKQEVLKARANAEKCNPQTGSNADMNS